METDSKLLFVQWAKGTKAKRHVIKMFLLNVNNAIVPELNSSYLE